MIIMQLRIVNIQSIHLILHGPSLGHALKPSPKQFNMTLNIENEGERFLTRF